MKFPMPNRSGIYEAKLPMPNPYYQGNMSRKSQYQIHNIKNIMNQNSQCQNHIIKKI
jgi:hypothetical protein